jgi:hypothetical protein
MITADKKENTMKDRFCSVNMTNKPHSIFLSTNSLKQTQTFPKQNDVLFSQPLFVTEISNRQGGSTKASAENTETDLETNTSEKRTYLNYFSLPKFGLCEKSTQTMLTGRDIDELEALKGEFLANKKEYVSNLMKNNSEIFKKLHPPEINQNENIKNFVGIKRNCDSEIKIRSRKFITTDGSLFKPHIHFKDQTKIRKNGRAVNVSNVNETNNFIMFNEFKLEPKLLDDINLNDVITSLNKNSNMEPLIKKRKVFYIIIKYNRKVKPTLDERREKPEKIKIKKFDPYQYYKEEFKQSHPSMPEEEIEIVFFF